VANPLYPDRLCLHGGGGERLQYRSTRRGYHRDHHCRRDTPGRADARFTSSVSFAASRSFSYPPCSFSVSEIVLRFFVPAPRGATELAEVMKKVTALPPVEQRRFIEALSQSVARGSLPPAPEVIVADRSKSVTERQAALRIMRANLEKRRIDLKWGDQGMLEAYNRDKAHYDELAKELEEPAPR
jgi:hypothetical protein